MAQVNGKIHVFLIGIDIITEKIGNQIIMYALDVDNSEDELVSWTTVVHEADFNECVEVKEEMGEKDPVKSAIADFSLLGICMGDE